MAREFHIVMVCSGNTCRSPMAEALLKDKLSRAMGEETTVSVSSAGLFAFEGEPASAPAIETMKGYGIEIEAHRARPLTAELAGKADLILAMTEAHKEAILRRYPEIRGKVFTLAEFSGVEGAFDVDDPIGSSTEEYRRVAKQIDCYLDGVMRKLEERLHSDEDSHRK